MDLDDFKEMLRSTGADLWSLIDTAISVAARDHREELRSRRDGIVEKMYGVPLEGRRMERDQMFPGGRGVQVNENGDHDEKGAGFLSIQESEHGKEDEDDEEEHGDDGDGGRSCYDRTIDDEQTKILAIKELIEDPDQEEDALVDLLQNLADMDITFKALQETDIGRDVNSLRKHPSGEVRRLVKVLVRKWKDLVDDWVKLNSNETAASAIITDDDSPQQISGKRFQNGNHHVPEFGYSPNPHNGSFDRNNWESEQKAKVISSPPRKRQPTPTKQNLPAPSSAPPKVREQPKENLLDPDRLASARRRLQENYQEAENAKKQRTIQVMDIHDIPKPKNAYFPRNKQVKHR